ncbi:MAG: type IV secretory system conjugative DNA transfer family protein [Bacillus sp. (in: Bacteria)]|nr:type IV secretory system conjugative DNA transfer family protein [Bacillus sp. (in: firmicutes)]MCM1427850.1 type IV secretory system conjugative DNA transfer family protein [Eubacterium sp.]
MFDKKGYRIFVLDTIDMKNSMHYNPFRYIKQPKDILTLANTLYANLKPPDAGTPPDPFFDQAALLWLQAAIGYLWYEAPPEEQNIPMLLELLEADDVREDDEAYENAVDMLFAELEKKNPRHFAVKQRKKYKKAAGKTAKSILISVGSYLSPFDIPEVSELVSYDELQFDTYGDPGQKSILYVIISDTDTTYNFIPAILFTQMFNVLCYRADKEMGGKLATPVQFILDEFANIGKIPGFKILIATIRSRLMSVIMMLQTQSQLKDNYKEAAETITGNCDTSIFLGGQEKSTLEDLEKMLGKETIDLWNDSKTYSQNESTGMNYNKTGRELKNIYELNTMDRNKCIVRISGLPPFFSDKYDTTKHPNYKYTADYDERNTFDFEKYRKRLKRKEEVTIRFHKNDQYKVVL